MNTRRNFLIAGVSLLGASVWSACSPAGAQGPAGAEGSKPGDSAMENVKVKVFNRKGELVGPIQMPKVVKTNAQWQKQLTPAQYRIARGKDTERAFCGNLLDNHKEGVYTCICCGLPLFSSTSKFHSGTGWPSFFQPIAAENVAEHPDDSMGMSRTEALCARCDCHLGHVFDDGPKPTGLRFCMNSESLSFTDQDKLATLADPAAEHAPVTDHAPTTAPAVTSARAG